VLAGCRPGSIKGSNSFPGFTGSERESSTWAVGGRAGVLVTPRFLTYFDGGFTQARFDGVNYNFAFAGGGPSGLSLAAQTYNGWFIGSGFEYVVQLAAISRLVPQDRVSLFAARRQQRRERAANRLRRRHPRYWRCAQLAEGHAVHLDRIGVALQLVWAMNGLRGWGAEPGTKVPGFLPARARPRNRRRPAPARCRPLQSSKHWSLRLSMAAGSGAALSTRHAFQLFIRPRLRRLRAADHGRLALLFDGLTAPQRLVFT
jgi:hypothetical protein